MRLLVGFDGSKGGRDALELARVLGSEPESSALVAAVLFGGPLPVDLAGLGDDEAEEAKPIFEEARAELAGLAVETRAFGGASPGAILTGLAEAEGAEAEGFDAIVVGSPHRGPVGRVLIGSVGHNLLNGAPCGVFVAPRGYAEEERSAFRTIAVAYDGTPEARAALRRAEELARLFGASIRVLMVVSHPVVATVPGAVGGGYAPEVPHDPDRVISEAVDSIDPELDARGRRLDGAAAPQLIAGLAEVGADLLVTGSRGYGPGMRVLLGSVSRKLITDAPCPILVVPRS